MPTDDVEARVEELAAEVATLRKKVGDAKPKDAWDKAGVVATFMSSVVLATVGLVFTTCYSRRQEAAQTALELEKSRLNEVEVVSKFMGYLSSADSRQKRMAFIVIRQLSNTSLATELAAADASEAAARAATEIAVNRGASLQDRRLAGEALAQIALGAATDPRARKAAVEGAVQVAAVAGADTSQRNRANDVARSARGSSVGATYVPSGGPVRLALHAQSPVVVAYRLWVRRSADTVWAKLADGTGEGAVDAPLPTTGGDLRIAFWLGIGGNPNSAFRLQLTAAQGATSLLARTITGAIPGGGLAVQTGEIAFTPAPE